MKERFSKLLEVKTIISLSVVFSLVFMYVNGQVPNEIFIPIATMVLTYFFNRKENDKKDT